MLDVSASGVIWLFSTMDQEPEPSEKPTTRPPDLSGPPNLSTPANTPPPDLKKPDLAPPTMRPPDFTPPPSVPPISIPTPSPAPAPTSFGPPPSIPIPEEAKKKPKVELPDPDEVKVGDLAPFNTRVIAALIDSGVGFCLYLVLTIILPGALDFLGSLVWLGYTFTKDSIPFLGGQSIGKKVMKLKVLTTDEKPLTGDWKTGAIRNLTMLIAPVEFVVLLLREEKPQKGIRLGDEFAKTRVFFIGEPAVPATEE